MILLDGKALRDKIIENVKRKVIENNLNITLAIIYVGFNEASEIYIRNKQTSCEKAGINSKVFKLSESISEEELIKLIENLNSDKNITGIILQSPIPGHLDFDKCCMKILPTKDVDGFTKDNIYNLYLNKESILPCTVKGIIRLLDEYKINLEGKNVVIVGRGNIVGKPLINALLNRNATITVAHSKTKNLGNITKNADILISAVGNPLLITEDMVKDGTVIIDVGINKYNGKTVGDVDFENVKAKCSYITPVPGGVGPMTVAMILDNLLEMKGKE